jgi:hypothetical protein
MRQFKVPPGGDGQVITSISPSTASYRDAQKFEAADSQSAYYSQLYAAYLVRELPLVRLRTSIDCLHSVVSWLRRRHEC